MSGSYMMYAQHEARPPLDSFEPVRDVMPNFSMRMTDMTAALLRPQLRELETWIGIWNRSYACLEASIAAIPKLRPIARGPREAYVGSSIQFMVEELDRSAIEHFVAQTNATVFS